MQVIGLGDVEHEADGIDRDDGREQGGALLAALDQVAGIDLAVGDAAGQRRAHVGPVEVQLGVALGGLGGLELGLGDRECGLALVVLGVGNVPGLDQGRAALDLQLGDVDLRLHARHIGLGALDRDLERPLVDGEQRIADIDDLAVLEVDLVDEARDAGSHFD